MLMDHPFRRNRQTFDSKQELESAPEVPSEDKILRQLEGMVFRDKSAGTTPEPIESTKKDCKRKKKTKKRKRKRNNKKKEPAAAEIL